MFGFEGCDARVGLGVILGILGRCFDGDYLAFCGDFGWMGFSLLGINNILYKSM